MVNFKQLLELVADITDPQDDDGAWERWERFHDGWEVFTGEEPSASELRLAERF